MALIDISGAICTMPDYDFEQSRLSAAILASSNARVRQLEQLARECGCLLRQFGEDCDFLLIACHSETEADGQDWSEVAHYLKTHDSEALVWSDLDAIDGAYSALPAERCHFLVNAADWQAVAILTGVGRRIRKYRVHEGNGQDETLALHRISSELADFARTLARIAEQDESAGNNLRDKPVGFRPAPPTLLDPKGWQAPPSPKPVDVRAMIKLRRMRDRFFEPSLFADPGWDILLDLYAAADEGKSVSVSSLCIAAAVPPTTALRWITNMTEAGLLVRVQDPGDARRVFIELSPDTLKQMQAYFEIAAAMPGPAI
jgi:DNA-binding MarR family transcriptional regulator